MVRIGTVSRLGPTQVRSTRRKPVSEPDASPEPAETAAQALHQTRAALRTSELS